MAKWRLLFMSLPVVAIVLGLRYLVHDVAGINDVVSFSDAGAVLTGASIIVGLMLGGVIADYKESEKLPAALAGSISGFEGLALRGLEAKGADDSWVHPRITKTATAINDWLYGRISDDEMFKATGDNAQLIVDLDNPFDYGANGEKGSAADVDLSPWKKLYVSILQK